MGFYQNRIPGALALRAALYEIVTQLEATALSLPTWPKLARAVEHANTLLRGDERLRTAPPVERSEVEALAQQFLLSLRAHFISRPSVPETNLEALNALAIAAASIIAGARETGNEAMARAFFDVALENQIKEFQQGRT
jgi:hypothetical protein